jgi:hypothetical protein
MNAQEAFDSAVTTQRYQEALDLLYAVGCQYNVKDDYMRQLCNHAGVCWFDLQRHFTGKPAAINAGVH